MLYETPNWNIKEYIRPIWPLDQLQIRHLSHKHEMSLGALHTLNLYLRFHLHPLQGDYFISQEKKIKLYTQMLKIERAFKSFDGKISQFVAEMEKTLLPDHFVQPAENKYRESFLGELNHFRTLLNLSQANFKTIIENNKDMSKKYSNQFTKRNRYTKGVIKSIFISWTKMGRKLTYTTHPDTSERSGRLIEYVNDVVRCISTPPGRLSAETIRKEIDRERKRITHPSYKLPTVQANVSN